MHTIVPVLGLNEVILNEGFVGAETKQIADVVADRFVVARAVRKAEDALVLTADGDQIEHRWVRTALSQGAKELSTLR